LILVDTSIWIDHLRRRHARLAALLDAGRVMVHPFVIGEIALGALRRRDEVLGLLAELPAARVARHEDVLAVVERRGLAGAGIGWVDAHLLASALVEHLPLWTLDRRLVAVSRKLGVAWDG
jgi:predicted nucleic acid-binding protein